MASLSPQAKQRFFDANGHPLVGGKLFTYQAGTSTPKATFVNKDNTPNTNPIILDGEGYCDLWLGSGYYKFVLTNSDNVELWSRDKISANSPTGGTITADSISTDELVLPLVAPSKVLITDADSKVIASAVTSTELTSLTGVSGNVQTQITGVGTSLSTHVADTAAHGATGAVVGTTNTQTLTNKTLTSPTIDTPLVNVQSMTEQGVAPATPAAGTRKFYAKTDGFYHLDSAGLEKKVGSGSGGGGVNLITDGDAEGTNPFSTYKDAGAASPVDGTGGTAAFVSIAISPTAPLSGTNSFVITKAFGNPIGEGVSVPFTVQPAYKARMLKISFDYFASTGFELPDTNFNGDVTIWIYDVTAGKLIQPSNFKITTRDNNGTFQADFQSDYASSNYRLIFHCGTVNTAAWTFKFDNVSVAPSQYVYAATSTDWTAPGAWVPTGSWTTNTTYSGRWRREGPDLLGEVKIALTGTPTGGNLTINMPSGLNIDPNKPSQSMVASIANIDVTGKVWNGSGTLIGLTGTTNNSTSFYVAYAASLTTMSVVSPTVPFAMNSSCTVNVEFRVPIQGWSSNQQVSDGYDPRDLSLAMFTNTAQLLTTSTWTKKTFLITNLTKGLTWDAVNSRVVVASAGTYSLSAFAAFGSTGAYSGQVLIYKNGTPTDISAANAGTQVGVTAFGLIDLKATDYIEVFVLQTSGANLNCTSAQFNISKNQAPTTISATELILASAHIGGGATVQALGSGAINFGVVKADTHGRLSTVSSGTRFTAGIEGWYALDVGLRPAATTTLYIYKNNASYLEFFAIGGGLSGSGSKKIYLLAGESVDIRSGGATTTQAEGYFDIVRCK